MVSVDTVVGENISHVVCDAQILLGSDKIFTVVFLLHRERLRVGIISKNEQKRIFIIRKYKYKPCNIGFHVQYCILYYYTVFTCTKGPPRISDIQFVVKDWWGGPLPVSFSNLGWMSSS